MDAGLIDSGQLPVFRGVRQIAANVGMRTPALCTTHTRPKRISGRVLGPYTAVARRHFGRTAGCCHVLLSPRAESNPVSSRTTTVRDPDGAEYGGSSNRKSRCLLSNFPT